MSAEASKVRQTDPRSRFRGKSPLTAAAILALFAMFGSGMVAFVHDHTRARIEDNERRVLLRNLTKVLPASLYTNDPVRDIRTVHAPAFLGVESATVYRARRNGRPVAAVFTAVAPNGYSGPIKLLVGVDSGGELTGVRVISHRETPGLGDGIEAEKSDWILGFTGRSLDDPKPSAWRVKREGGVFDQFTGATITPRAIVEAVRKCLVYFRENRNEIFSERAEKRGTPPALERFE